MITEFRIVAPVSILAANADDRTLDVRIGDDTTVGDDCVPDSLPALILLAGKNRGWV